MPKFASVKQVPAPGYLRRGTAMALAHAGAGKIGRWCAVWRRNSGSTPISCSRSCRSNPATAPMPYRRNAQGLMQLIPDTAERFGVKDPFDAKDNMRGALSALAAGLFPGRRIPWWPPPTMPRGARWNAIAAFRPEGNGNLREAPERFTRASATRSNPGSPEPPTCSPGPRSRNWIDPAPPANMNRQPTRRGASTV